MGKLGLLLFFEKGGFATPSYKKAFSLGGLRCFGFVIQCLCYSEFVIPFQSMWIANPPKAANGLQIRWNRGALKERHQFSLGCKP